MFHSLRVAVLTAIALILGVSGPAVAAPPESFPYDFSGVAVQQEDCPGGYDVLIAFEGRGLTKVFFDRNADIVRISDWSMGSGTLINSEDPSKTETGMSPHMLILDLRKMTFSVTGTLAHNNIPGEGRVAHDSGLLVYELLSFQPDTFEFELGRLLHSGGQHPESIDWCSMVD